MSSDGERFGNRMCCAKGIALGAAEPIAKMPACHGEARSIIGYSMVAACGPGDGERGACSTFRFPWFAAASKPLGERSHRVVEGPFNRPVLIPYSPIIACQTRLPPRMLLSRRSPFR